MTEKDFRFEALHETIFLHLPLYPRISCEACVFCDPNNESDGGTADKPMSHLHHLSPLLGSPLHWALCRALNQDLNGVFVTHLPNCSMKTC